MRDTRAAFAEYVATRSEHAFPDVVSSYLDLVYSATSEFKLRFGSRPNGR
jgi:hypothetical protein